MTTQGRVYRTGIRKEGRNFSEQPSHLICSLARSHCEASSVEFLKNNYCKYLQEINALGHLYSKTFESDQTREECSARNPPLTQIFSISPLSTLKSTVSSLHSPVDYFQPISPADFTFPQLEMEKYPTNSQ